MATLLLTAVGTALGGPIGGAIGALAGKQIDGSIFGSGSREGPRLKELSVTTSSYGQPIARHYGEMRVPGTVIWATDLEEKRETSGGGKGKPKTTTFSYSVSFAVALSSRPIDGIGRIWADGNLLRGAAGDLKTGGTLRIYNGWADQPLDPLLSAAEGASCPAFRCTAYVVFEDLQLADFGNRIPALSFEIFSGSGSEVIPALLDGIEESIADASVSASPISGYAWEGGTLGLSLQTIDAILPLVTITQGSNLEISRSEEGENASPIALPPASSAWDEGDFGEFEGHRRRRDAGDQQRPEVLRYYDPERDYQPGTQRAIGRTANARSRTIEFPGSLFSGTARELIDKAASNAVQRREVLSWRAVELDPAIKPGSVVTAPGFGGEWRVEGWEWRERGVELELVRMGGASISGAQSDPGRAWTSPDLEVTPTILRAFELPLETSGQADIPAIYAATMSESAGWPGASLYADVGGELVSIEASSRTRAFGGTLSSPLEPSQSIRFECDATLDLQLYSDEQELISATLTALSFGANRLLVGSEIVQFAEAEKIAASSWRLTGLLRGRGGTESAAAAGHSAGAEVTLIDDRLISLDSATVAGASQLAAIGPVDVAPVYAALENPGLTRKPLTPVHARNVINSDGSLCQSWTRRARGAWGWLEDVDVPLVEEIEQYRVGLGPVGQPHVVWETSEPLLVIESAQLASLQTNHPGEALWVRQIGSHAQSDPLSLGAIS